jgi:hypothetical protein
MNQNEWRQATAVLLNCLSDCGTCENEECSALTTTDIIPDIHGQAEKLFLALKNLGWQRNGTTWLHSECDRQIVFLGDFIDRGPENAAVIRTVRELMDSGRAQAILGNHEINALHFHTEDPQTGRPLREHSPKNIKQHESFLKEFPHDAVKTKEVLSWMRQLPLFIETNEFRVIHAAWIESMIRIIREKTKDGLLSEDQIILSGRKGDLFNDIVEAVAKGPELALPYSYKFFDKDGHDQRNIRLKWWNGEGNSWREIAMSVPDIKQLPEEPLPDDFLATGYPAGERPVFFGHYWLSGEPELQSKNALCLDYSAGTDGPLVTYTHVAASRDLSLENVVVHQ